MSAPEPSRAQEVQAAIAALRGAARSVADRRSDAPRVIDALRAAALILSDTRHPVALDLRRELQEETGLSMAMIEWGLVTSLSSVRHAPLAELTSTIPAEAPREVIGVVLAGNVFVAAVRGLALPLLAGAHVIAKTASGEGAFARAFRAALTEADPGIRARLTVVEFSRDDEAATRALCTGVDALSVYGSDETVEQLRRLCASPAGHDEGQSSSTHGPTAFASDVTRDDHRHAQAAPIRQRAAEEAWTTTATNVAAKPASQRPSLDDARKSRQDIATSRLEASRSASVSPRVIAHGHGLSAAYVARSALSSPEQAARAAERVALDISAYDQHGCLSPHFVLVEPGGAVEPRAFAQLLAAEALPALAQLLPPAEPTLPEQAEHMQWQATAAIRGELYAHATHAVSYEELPVRPSPGGRRISVYACADHQQLREQLEPFAKHLKLLGVAGSKTERTAVATLLQRFCSAQVCRSGEMQSPPFDAWADGAPPLTGLFRT